MSHFHSIDSQDAVVSHRHAHWPLTLILTTLVCFGFTFAARLGSSGLFMFAAAAFIAGTSFAFAARTGRLSQFDAMAFGVVVAVAFFVAAFSFGHASFLMLPAITVFFSFVSGLAFFFGKKSSPGFDLKRTFSFGSFPFTKSFFSSLSLAASFLFAFFAAGFARF